MIHKVFPAFSERCARATTSGNTEATKVTWSADVSRPREKRTRELASDFSIPKAVITWDGSRDPAEQAEPLDAQIPSISKPANNAMLSVPATTKETVLIR